MTGISVRRFLPDRLVNRIRDLVRDGKYSANYIRHLNVSPVFSPCVSVEREGDTDPLSPFFVGTSRGLLLYREGGFIRLCGGKVYGITFERPDDLLFFQRLPESFGRLVRCDTVTGGLRPLVNFLSTGIHQIDFIQGRMAVMDTYNNALCFYDPAGKAVRRLYPNGPLENGRSSPNYCHFNSVFATPDQVFLVAHNQTKKTGRSSEIYRLDRELRHLEVLATRSGAAHNVALIQGDLWHCNSLEGTLVVGECPVFQDRRYFTRGLAVNERHVLVGGSEFAKRSDRAASSGVVVALNRSFEEVGRFRLRGCGDVYEIRFLEQDLCMSGTGSGDRGRSRPLSLESSGAETPFRETGNGAGL